MNGISILKENVLLYLRNILYPIPAINKAKINSTERKVLEKNLEFQNGCKKIPKHIL